MNIDHWREFATVYRWKRFSKTYAEYYESSLQSGNYVDLLGIDEIGSKEVRYSAFLAWLLDCKGDHGQGNIFLMELINHLIELYSTHSLENIRDDFMNAQYTVVTECWMTKKRRVDLLIESSKARLAIEVKVKSKESINQTKDYQARLKELSLIDKKEWKLLFLTVNGDYSDYALPIRWKEISRVCSKGLKRSVERHLEFMNSLAYSIIYQFSKRILVLR